MKTLPFDLQKPFFTLLPEQGSLSDFETWLYNEPNLEKYLTPDDYLALISLDFKDKRSIIEIEKLSTPYLDYLAYYHDKLSDTLLSLTHNPSDLHKLAQLYDWYCQGYKFLRKLALDYGFYADLYFWGEQYHLEFLNNSMDGIRQQAKWLYDDFIAGKIQLLTPPNYADNINHYQDFRNCDEKKRTDY